MWTCSNKQCESKVPIDTFLNIIYFYLVKTNLLFSLFRLGYNFSDIIRNYNRISQKNDVFYKQELNELAELKQQRETELKDELESMKENLQKKLEQSEQQKLEMEQNLSKQLEMMKELSHIEQSNIELLVSPMFINARSLYFRCYSFILL